MNHNLDSLPFLQSLDSAHMSASIASLSDQVKAAWQGVLELSLPQEFRTKKNIVLSGMGGSALGGRIIQSAFFDSLRAPFFVTTETTVPHWVNSDSLVIISSYSGNTAETIDALRDAQKQHASIFIIAAGGKLAEIAEKEEISCFIFDPKENPSGQPRMALGYAIGSLLSLLTKLEFVSVSLEQLDLLYKLLDLKNEEFGPRTHTNKNHAKLQAQKLYQKSVVLVASQPLTGVAYAFKNQLNENAKTFATLFDLPELNHHFLEGLQFPLSAKQNTHLLFFESEIYKEEYQKRYGITQEVVEKNHFQFSMYKMQSKTKLEQVFELLIFGSYVSFYLALLNGIDPAPIPWVDYFKERVGP